MKTDIVLPDSLKQDMYLDSEEVNLSQYLARDRYHLLSSFFSSSEKWGEEGDDEREESSHVSS